MKSLKIVIIGVYIIFAITNFFLFTAFASSQTYQMWSVIILIFNMMIFIKFGRFYNFRREILFFLFLLFAVPFLLSFFTFFSDIYILIFPKLLIRFSFFLLGLVFFGIIQEGSPIIKHLLIILYLFVIYFSFYFQLFYFDDYKVVLSLVGANANAFLTTGRFMGWIGQSNQFAYSVFFFIVIGYFLIGRKFYFYLPFFIFLILFSGSRTVFLMVIIMVFVDIIRVIHVFSIRNLVVVILIICSLTLIWKQLGSLNLEPIDRLNFDFSSLENDNSLDERKLGRDSYLLKIFENPFGHGFGSDAFFMRFDSSFVLSAHSDIIRDAYEYGLLYGILLVSCWLYILLQFFLSGNFFNFSVFSLVMTAYIFAGNIRDVNIYFFYLALLFCMIKENSDL
jgi:hypothetical protein